MSNSKTREYDEVNSGDDEGDAQEGDCESSRGSGSKKKSESEQETAVEENNRGDVSNTQVEGAWTATEDEQKLFAKFAPSLRFQLPLLPCQVDRLCAVSRALSLPEPLLCVVLQYFGGVYRWLDNGISKFKAPAEHSEGASGWNPLTDEYYIKSDYWARGSLTRYHPDTSLSLATSPSTAPGLSMAFDASGHCYLAGWDKYYYKLDPECKRVIWKSTGAETTDSSTTGIAVNPSDGLVYASKISSDVVEVLNPETGAVIRTLRFQGQMTSGQCHPMICAPMGVAGEQQWVLFIHDQHTQCANVYEIDVINCTATFLKEFKHGIHGYCTYIFDAKRSRLLIAQNGSTSKWREWIWVP